MKPMTETQLLCRLGANPSLEALSESLGDFLDSHGHHDAARIVTRKLDSAFDYECDYFGDGIVPAETVKIVDDATAKALGEALP